MSNSNGHIKPMSPEARKTLAAKMKAEGEQLIKQGRKQEGQTLLFRASEVALKVGEGPFKKPVPA